jgi:hypothetical protein
MKKILFIVLVVAGLLLPLSAFAANSFMDMFLGGGYTSLSGTYNGYGYGIQDYQFIDNIPQNGNVSNGTGDFIFGMDYYWMLNDDHTFWMGIGSTLSMAFPTGSVAPETISIDVPFEYLIATHFSIVVKPSLLVAWLPCQGATVSNSYYANLFGYGFSIAAGPTIYFDKNDNIGLCGLVGYKYLTGSGGDDNGNNTTFNGGGVYVQVYFTFELWSDDQE